jgi:hypothetical protein
VAIITAGDTNFFLATTFRPTVSVVEVDGAPPKNAYGPIELEPGPHTVKLKCGDLISEQNITAAAGEVYQFGIGMGRTLSGCRGVLGRFR